MTRRPARPVTAAELSARLAADPDYATRRRAIDEAVAKRAAEYQALAPR